MRRAFSNLVAAIARERHAYRAMMCRERGTAGHRKAEAAHAKAEDALAAALANMQAAIDKESQ